MAHAQLNALTVDLEDWYHPEYIRRKVNPNSVFSMIEESTSYSLDLFEKLKIERDKRTKFKPHLTIGRLKKGKINYKTFDTLKNLINENKNLEFGEFNINLFKLKISC